MSQQILKTIHYFWFGGKPKSAITLKCIDSWKKYCPDYKIIEWNESNYDLDKIQFCRDAYNSKKWAFVVDAARLDVIYNYGGVCLDVDVEIIKNMDDLLNLTAFAGFENDQYINFGLGFGAKPKCPIIKELLHRYKEIDFRKHIKDLNKITLPLVITDVLQRKGLKKDGSLQTIDDLTLLPADYLAPKNLFTRIINLTENTYSIHYYDASWVSADEKSMIGELDRQGINSMKKRQALVSIVIPVYNGEDYLKKAIDSALDQTYKNTEIIIVDDGSIDNTEKIVKEYGARIRYFKKENGGVSTALNFGIKKMTGEYFSWLSHDDVYYPEKVETLIDKISPKDENTILVSDWSIIDENSNFIKDNILDDALETNPRAFLAFDRKTWLNGCAMLIPKSLFDKYGLFDEKLRTTQDYDFFYRLMNEKVKFKIVHRPLLYSRAHSKQGSLSDSGSLNNSDLMHKEIISSLTPSEIDRYFLNNYSKMLSSYESFICNGYVLAPSYILNSLILNMLNKKVYSMAGRLIEDKLVGGEIGFCDNNTYEILNNIQKKSQKKRLLFASGYWLTGGVERVLANLFKNLNSDYELFLVTPFDGRKSKIIIPSHVNHIKISADSYNNNFDTILLSYALLLKADVVMGNINLFEKQLNFYKSCEHESFKTVAINHESYFYPYDYPDYHTIALRRLDAYKNIDAAVWLTNFSCSVYNSFNNNGYLIPNPSSFNVQKVIVDNKKTIISIGRFNDRVKRVDRVLKCFKMVLDKMPDAKLLLVGPCDRSGFAGDSEQTISSLLSRLNISPTSINFVGEVSDVGKYLSKSDVLLLTSESEGFPMVINEAASYAVPTVCNYFPGVEDIIIQGENGYISEQDDIESMSSHICDIFTNNELRQNLSRKSQLLVKRFEPEKVANKWKFLLGTILETSSNKDKSSKLNKKIGCAINDYQLFSRDLLKEMNKVISIGVEKLQDSLLREATSCRNCEALHQSHSWVITKLGRLIKDGVVYMMHFGLTPTAKKVLKKIYKKIRSAIR